MYSVFFTFTAQGSAGFSQVMEAEHLRDDESAPVWGSSEFAEVAVATRNPTLRCFS